MAPQPSETEHVPLTIEPTLLFTSDGGAIVRFADVSTMPRPMEWSLIFNRKGTLLKATHSPAAVVRALPNLVPVLSVQDVDPAHKQP